MAEKRCLLDDEKETVGIKKAKKQTNNQKYKVVYKKKIYEMSRTVYEMGQLCALFNLQC